MNIEDSLSPLSQSQSQTQIYFPQASSPQADFQNFLNDFGFETAKEPLNEFYLHTSSEKICDKNWATIFANQVVGFKDQPIKAYIRKGCKNLMKQDLSGIFLGASSYKGGMPTKSIFGNLIYKISIDEVIKNNLGAFKKLFFSDYYQFNSLSPLYYVMLIVAYNEIHEEFLKRAQYVELDWDNNPFLIKEGEKTYVIENYTPERTVYVDLFYLGGIYPRMKLEYKKVELLQKKKKETIEDKLLSVRIQ